jgi:serpin B
LHADFSGITGHTPPHEDSLVLSAVFHQACVEVNEEGAEAAAATATVLRDGTATRPVVTFRADHPFLFAIRDTTSGSEASPTDAAGVDTTTTAPDIRAPPTQSRV